MRVLIALALPPLVLSVFSVTSSPYHWDDVAIFNISLYSCCAKPIYLSFDFVAHLCVIKPPLHLSDIHISGDWYPHIILQHTFAALLYIPSLYQVVRIYIMKLIS
ncbi:hypothetical protein BJ912DRAFT_965035 [Pholiota molesta]|nr:hypothetical protein BJ912DRAFT_965035 [Pholiota molesta]